MRNCSRRTKPCIIFVMSKREAETMALALGLVCIHSKLEPSVRMRLIKDVLAGKARCVATTSIGVGVNLNPLHLVIYGLT
jgi:hypothetical protein